MKVIVIDAIDGDVLEVLETNSEKAAQKFEDDSMQNYGSEIEILREE